MGWNRSGCNVENLRCDVDTQQQAGGRYVDAQDVFTRRYGIAALWKNLGVISSFSGSILTRSVSQFVSIYSRIFGIFLKKLKKQL